ncbi:hypothetical protein ACH5RR_026118 [Cinchona calisaya]|uniref:Myb/SANT-like domain-containing protein n=1 Tax=Cinchona calisaya TaxID=153742 RepID=A0ABD2Z3J2_9GENT
MGSRLTSEFWGKFSINYPQTPGVSLFTYLQILGSLALFPNTSIVSLQLFSLRLNILGSCTSQIDSKFRCTSGFHTVCHHHIRLPPSTACIRPCHSSSASTDFKLSLRNYFKLADKPKWKWNEECEFKFFSTYVEWKLNGQWDRKLLTRQKYNKLVQFVNETYGMAAIADILSSKYYRFFEKWKLYNELRGICKQATTGG